MWFLGTNANQRTKQEEVWDLFIKGIENINFHKVRGTTIIRKHSMFSNKSPFRHSIKKTLRLQKRCQGLVPAALPQKESEIQIVERGG